MESANSRHLQSLTSLRFIAAILVVVFHLSIYLERLPTVGRLLADGYVGVTFFFVLSGFVLTYSWDASSSVPSFYRRRLARVYPVHLLFIAVAMLPLSSPPNWSALPANVLLLQSWFPDDAVVRSFSGVSWSLSCEFFFYATFPLIVRRLRRLHRPRRAADALVVAALAGGIALQLREPGVGFWLFHLPPFRMVEFTCGSLAASAMLRGWSPRMPVRQAGALVLASYCAVLLLPLAIGYRLEDRWAFGLAMVPGFVALISSCARGDMVGAPSLLRHRTMVSLGEWSFCLYMAHPVVIILTLPLLRSRSLFGAILGCVLVTFAAVGASYLIHTTFERPLERWLRGATGRRLSSDPSVCTIESAQPAPAVEPAARSVGYSLRSRVKRPT